MNPEPDRDQIASLGGYRFCPRCSRATALVRENEHERLACTSCDFIYYRNPVPACGALIERGGRILLVRRAFEPKKGMWSIPAGFMEYGETPSACCEREVLEETGLAVRVGNLVGVYSGFDDPRFHAVLIVYRAADPGTEPIPGDDADEIAWVVSDDLPSNMAFRAHLEAIRDYRVMHSGDSVP